MMANKLKITIAKTSHVFKKVHKLVLGHVQNHPAACAAHGLRFEQACSTQMKSSVSFLSCPFRMFLLKLIISLLNTYTHENPPQRCQSLPLHLILYLGDFST